MTKKAYSVVDLFAGAGGLGDGFASLKRGAKLGFEVVASIERDRHACDTLRLRHFFRNFAQNPEEYDGYLAGEITREELISKYQAQWEKADRTVFEAELGKNNRAIKERIAENINGNGRWVLLGGPPCQAYSLIGRARMQSSPDYDYEKDYRLFLYKEFVKMIHEYEPPVFVLENVRGLLSAEVNGSSLINKIIESLEGTKNRKKARYSLHSLCEDASTKNSPERFLIKAENFGVPQARHRLLIVGIREDLGKNPERLLPKEKVTVRDAIGDLPRLRSGISKEEDSYEAWRSILIGADKRLKAKIKELPIAKRADSYAKELPSGDLGEWFIARRPTGLTGHETRTHMRSDLMRYFFAATYTAREKRSPHIRDFPKKLLPDHKSVKNKQKHVFSDRFRVQLADRASSTVTSHIAKDGHYFIHYDPLQCRSLTVREAARLQTFPDNYHFEGPRTEQYRQIGNAVPPYLANQIAEIIAEVLDQM